MIYCNGVSQGMPLSTAFPVTFISFSAIKHVVSRLFEKCHGTYSPQIVILGENPPTISHKFLIFLGREFSSTLEHALMYKFC
jgi:hypothetical protein